MPGEKTRLTNREKAVLLLYVLGIETSWKELYLSAEDKSRADAEKHTSLNPLVSRWKNSEKVRTCIEDLRRIIADRDSDARRRGAEEERTRNEQRQFDQAESEPTNGKQKKDFAPVDYYNPENQRTQINRIIAESKDDPKTQLDAIKAIQQTQRDDRQAARDQKQVHAYLPQRCESCPLYLKAKERTIK